MKVAEALVRILEEEGVSIAFGIPGAGINSLYEFLGKSEKIQHMTMRHEAACIHAADAYYRASGKLAFAVCTAGPGATNFVTGLYTAWIDSIPLIAITGQANVAQLQNDPFQCVDIAKIAETVAKKTYRVTDARDAVRVLREAFTLARSGRKGPVLIDLPLDVQMAEFEGELGRSLPLLPTPAPEAAQIEAALALVDAAKAPVMIVGGGVMQSDATGAALELAEYLQLPIITTYMAKGAVPEDHPLNAGHAGIQVGQPIGNKTLTESDVVLAIGCRFNDRHTGAIASYVKDRKFIHIDIDEKELGKIVKPVVAIHADAGQAIAALLQEAKKKPTRAGVERVRELPKTREALQRKTDYDQKPIKAQRVYQAINEVFAERAMFTVGCGLVQIWSGQLQKVSTPRRYLPSGGAGTLGFELPAAIGAMKGNPGMKAVAVVGDFGFTFMVEELAVAAANDVPMIVVLVNNAYLSLIRQNQKYAYQYEYAVHMPENQSLIDYVKVAEGFGCTAERVFDPAELEAAMQRALASKRPYVIDIICEEATDCSMGGAVDAVREFV